MLKQARFDVPRALHEIISRRINKAPFSRTSRILRPYDIALEKEFMSKLIMCLTSLTSWKIIRNVCFFIMLCLVPVVCPHTAHADDCNPIQISVWPSVQLVSKENAICGARLDLLWGENTSVRGIDVGLANVTGSLKGIEIGGFNWLAGDAKEDSWGIQIAGINYVSNSSFSGIQIGFQNQGSSKTSLAGIQAALINFDFGEGEINGIQLGVANGWSNINGLQIGFWNEAKDVNGLQIGLFFPNLSKGNVNGLQIGLFLNGSSGMVHGMQIGLVNVCESLTGVQIGILNIVTSRFPDKGLFVSPLINVGF